MKKEEEKVKDEQRGKEGKRCFKNELRDSPEKYIACQSSQ